MKMFKKWIFSPLMALIALLGIQSVSFDMAYALTINYGTPIIAIDGNGDANVTVDILSAGHSPNYAYGYFLNGDYSSFNQIIGFRSDIFTGGDIIDFALFDGAKYYTLSGDLADPSYSVEITFANQVTVGMPQQPAGWTAPYYYSANMTWTLPTIVNTNELALNFQNNSNDGIAPVPEPGTLLLLGAGLVGVGFFARRRKK